MAKSSDRMTKFVFTLNNYTAEEQQQICDWASTNAKFAVVGKEVGENGTPHLQGYINLKKQQRFSAIKKVLPKAHLEKAVGTDQQNLTYCTKQDADAVIIGEPQTPGKRNDLAAACKKIKEGAPITEIAQEHPETFVRYNRGLQTLIETIQRPRDVNDPPMVLWLYGATGTGKTRFAYDSMPHDQIYTKDSTRWWNGYTHQQCILVDDYDGEWPFRDFLRFLDRYPYRGQTKGAYVDINSPIIIITSEHPPSTFYQNTELKQVLRRIQHVVNMGEEH